jgi:hypothetical protein
LQSRQEHILPMDRNLLFRMTNSILLLQMENMKELGLFTEEFRMNIWIL